MILERHPVEAPRVGVSVRLRQPLRAHLVLVRRGEQFAADAVVERRALEPASVRIHHEGAVRLPERGTEVERGAPAATEVAGAADRHLGRRPRPGLVVEHVPVDPNRPVELVEERAADRREEQRRRLVAHEALAADEDFVAPGEPSEDRVVVEHETARAPARLPLEEQRGGQPADPAADDGAVDRVGDADVLELQRGDRRVPEAMPFLQHGPRVPVGVRVVADAAVAVERRGAVAREQFEGAAARDECRPRSEQDGVEEIAPRDAGFEAERARTGHATSGGLGLRQCSRRREGRAARCRPARSRPDRAASELSSTMPG